MERRNADNEQDVERQSENEAGKDLVGIAELLEQILVNVDMRTILLSQRVNKHWNNVISGSTKLQKKLFFIQPTIDDAVKLNLVSSNIGVYLTPEITTPPILVNPLLFNLAVGEYYYHHNPTDDEPPFRTKAGGGLLRAGIRENLETAQSGSWERMWPRTFFEKQYDIYQCAAYEVIIVPSEAVEPPPIDICRTIGKICEGTRRLPTHCFGPGEKTMGPALDAMFHMFWKSTGDYEKETFPWDRAQFVMERIPTTFSTAQKAAHLAQSLEEDDYRNLETVRLDQMGWEIDEACLEKDLACISTDCHWKASRRRCLFFKGVRGS